MLTMSQVSGCRVVSDAAAWSRRFRGAIPVTEIFWYGAIAISLSAGWSDWRTRRIPNWLTVSAFLVGVTANVLVYRWAGFRASLAGAGTALGLLLPFVLLRGMGAGDWKLMGALGAFLGPTRIVFVLFSAIVLAGVAACVMVTWRHRWGATLRNLRELLFGFAVFGLRPNPQIHLGNTTLPSLPFGSVVAVAVPLCYCGIRLLARI
jgi:prepilin peptidase CpaA